MSMYLSKKGGSFVKHKIHMEHTKTLSNNVEALETWFPPNMKGKKGKEMDGETRVEVKRNILSKIPEFWAAKYRCILMGVILFFSILEIIMFNVNNFLQGETTKTVMQKIIKKYFYTNHTRT